jgi:uncharacterized iron-regulated protein
VAAVQPRALVFEMLTKAQALRHQPGADAATLAARFDWVNSGWPDFAMYHPIFAAAPDARIFGAGVPRAAADMLRDKGIAFTFGIGAGAYGLTEPLGEAEQVAREAFQQAAHCDGLPDDLLPFMVEFQRLRDAELARMAVRALELTGGPVVVITGNGHARQDWGMPVYFSRVKPEAKLLVLGQGEKGAPKPPGAFDMVEYHPSIARTDPCRALRQ